MGQASLVPLTNCITPYLVPHEGVVAGWKAIRLCSITISGLRGENLGRMGFFPLVPRAG